MDPLTAFARGPLFTACFLFMAIGLARHVLLRTRDLIRVRKRTPKRDVPWKDVVSTSADWALPVRHLFGEVPALTISSVLFHIGIVLVPIFFAAHTRLWALALGIHLPSLPAGIADALTIVTIAAGVLIFFVRIFRRAARDLSRISDYLLILLVLLPFVTGYFAVHPESAPFAYGTLMLVHVLSADLLLFLVPVTKLAHVVLFPFDRLSGDIFWRLVPGAGEKVCETLHGHTEGAEA